MVLWYQKKQPVVLGVDFNAVTVNVVALRFGEEGLSVEGIGSMPLASHVIVDHAIQDPLALGSALQWVSKEMGVKEERVMLALPMDRVIEKTVLVDAKLSEEELEAHMQLEAAASIPYPLTEVYRDFCVLGTDTKDVNKMEVLLVATRKEVVESRVSVLQQIGFNVYSVEVHSTALERMVNYLNHLQWVGETIAVLQFSTTIAFTVVNEGRAVYHREEITPMALGNIDALMSLLHRLLQLFFSTGDSHAIDKIWLIGADLNVCRILTENLSIHCEILDPFKGMSFSSKDLFPTDTSCFALACGLALKGNLQNDRH